MNHYFSNQFMARCVAAMIGASLCLTILQVRAAPVEPAKQTASEHPNALPSQFRNGELLIKVSVNGHPAAWMMLDTGTSESMIDADYATSIGLRLYPKAQGAQGFGSTTVPAFETGAVQLRVGAEPEKKVFFESIRLAGMVGPDGTQLAGLLGHSFLDQRIFVIDYKNQEAYFENAPQAADPRDIPMTLVEGIPRIRLKMANQMVGTLIDSGGSYGMIITPDTARKLGVEKFMDDAKAGRTVGHGGQQHVLVGKAPPFSIGDIAVRDATAAYTTFGTATDALDAGASLGIGFLKNYKITLNYPANTVRLEP